MRVKGGFGRKRHHKQVLARTKGFRMTKNRLYKVAREADVHAGQYAYIGRKQKKRQYRKLWIIRLNAYLKENGYTYHTFIKELKTHQIILNRKILSNIAIEHPEDLEQICQKVMLLKK